MKTFNKIIFLLGVLLLGINISGLFMTMRNPEIYAEENIIKNRKNDITIHYPDIKTLLLKKPDESNEVFAIRINKVVNDGFIHYWKEAGITKYNERVPVWENYLLFLASYIDPKDYRRYEFSDYKKNLERGVGLCSTHSIVVKGVLNDNGMDASLWDIAGHVVVRANVEKGKWIILDPDFGVVVPYDTAAIQENPELVRPAYKDMAALYYPEAKEPYTTDHVVEIYGRDGNHVYTVDNWFEHFSYWAIWCLPLLLILPYSIQLFRRNK
ncbi:MAG: hypothetical protein ABI760_16535 [Ferruginibacter sp.]